MEEFRPAHVVESDAALVTALRSDEMDALGELIERYGAPVTSVATAADADAADAIAHDVFVQAWRNSARLEPGSDLGAWLHGLTLRMTAARGAPIDELEARTVWSAAVSIGSLDGDRREAVARWCQGEEDAAADDQQLIADRARIERKLAPRLEGVDPGGVLRRGAAWAVPAAGLFDRVRGSVDAESFVGEPGGHDGAAGEPGGLVSQRLLRSVLIGIVCAFGVLIAMIVVLSAIGSAPRQPDYTVEMTPTGVLPDVEGEITVTGRDVGVEIEISAPSLPRRGGDQNYRAVAVLFDGTPVTIGSFREGVDVTVTGGVDTAEVAEFLVVLGTVGDDGPVADTDVVLKVPNFQR